MSTRLKWRMLRQIWVGAGQRPAGQVQQNGMGIETYIYEGCWKGGIRVCTLRNLNIGPVWEGLLH